MRTIVAVAIVVLVGCHDHHEPHEHAKAHPEGHDHHDDGHGHEGAVVAFTHWSPRFELFGEHSVASVGEPISFLLHVTALDGFRAVTEGSVEISFSGPAQLRGTVDKPIRPGIFKVELTAAKAGDYGGKLTVSGRDAGTINGLKLRVYSTAAEAERAAPAEDDSSSIEFLKEQQWNVPFATEFATTATINDSSEVAGTVQTPPSGTAQVGAPVAGRIVAPRGGISHPGTAVKKGQLLATIQPTPSSPEGATRSALAVAEAEARAAAAARALERAERLVKDEAIPLAQLEAAQREAKVAAEAVRAAKRSASLYSGASGVGGRGTWRLVSPIAGVIDQVDVSPGKMVTPGEELFRVVDGTKLWLVAKVPEQDAARLRRDLDASYQVAGLEQWFQLTVVGDSANAAIVSVGKSVDPRSRTVEVIYSLEKPTPNLRVNGLVRLALPTGASVSGVAIPRSALVDRDGRSVVYVQVDGEHFVERAVRVRARAGDRVSVAGVSAGERIVTVGAHLVRLAERAGDTESHGHIH